LVVIGGTYVAWQGQPLLKAEKPSAFFEWRKQDAVTNAAPSEFSVTALFKELTDKELTGEELPGGSPRSSLGSNHISSPFAEKH
jgi:hypothetical protein